MTDCFYVYQLRREDSKLPFYIGKGKADRFKRHLTKSSLSKNSFKNNVIKKALSEGVKIVSEVLCYGMTELQALDAEAYLIKIHGRRDCGTGTLTNVTDGGEQGPTGAKFGPQSDEHKAKRFKDVRPAKPRTIASYDDSGKRITSEAHKENLRIAAAKSETKCCPHCNIVCKIAQFKRYHGDMCKILTGTGWSNPKVSGEANKRSVLTEEDVIEIRRLVSVGMSKASVSRLYNTTDTTICKIILRQSWAHVY